MRSWLFVRADSEKQLAKAPLAGADVLVVDFTGVASDVIGSPIRGEVADWLRQHGDTAARRSSFARWLRIKPLGEKHWRDDLVAAMAGAPGGVILPRARGPEDVRMLASELYEIEQQHGLTHNSTQILLQVGEEPEAALTMRDFLNDPHPRIAGFTWSAVNLARALGASRILAAGGRLPDALSLVRANTLLLAKALGLMAIETSASVADDAARGAAEALAAKRDGFTGMVAMHPRQIMPINEAFLPTAAEIAEADAIIALFEASPAAQSVIFRGRQLDRGALARAQQVLALS